MRKGGRETIELAEFVFRFVRAFGRNWGRNGGWRCSRYSRGGGDVCTRKYI